MFTDTIELLKDCPEGQDCETVKMNRKDIAWPRLKGKKYKKAIPKNGKGVSFQKPTRWRKSVEEQLGEDGVESEDFIVWMTIAPLANFRKLYGKFEKGLPKGKYSFKIDYEYLKKDEKGPEAKEKGSDGHTKSIVLSTTCLLGGRNPFLGYCFVLVGCISLVLGFVLILLFLKVRKRRSRVSALPLPQPPPQPPEEQVESPRTSATSSRKSPEPVPGAKPSTAHSVKA